MPRYATTGAMNPHAVNCAWRRARARRARDGADCAAPSPCRTADRVLNRSAVMALTSASRRRYLLIAAVAADWAAASALAGDAAPLSAFWTAVHSCWEMIGYLVPRLSPVRALATPTALTHELSDGSADTWACWPAWVGTM